MDKDVDPNQLFKFKQFAMVNDCVGLKVGTDSVLLGAWASVQNGDTVWDVGAGSGILSLMMAQRGAKGIYAFEIDCLASDVAKLNFELSPWSDKLHLLCGDVFGHCQDIAFPDFIISNPPYFPLSSSLPSRSEQRDAARRAESLSFITLLELASKYLGTLGRVAFVSPYENRDEIMYTAILNKMVLNRMTTVHMGKKRLPKRILWEFGKQEDSAPEITSLYVHDEFGKYTDEYVNLTCNFYLDKT